MFNVNKNYKIYIDLIKKNKQILQKITTLLKLKNYKLKYDINIYGNDIYHIKDVNTYISKLNKNINNKLSATILLFYNNNYDFCSMIKLYSNDILIYCESENILNTVLNKYHLTNNSCDKLDISMELNNNNNYINIKLFINMFLDICIKLLGSDYYA